MFDAPGMPVLVAPGPTVSVPPMATTNDAISFVADRVGETITVERKNTSKREAVAIAPALLARLEARLAPDIALYRRVQAGEFLPDTPHALARLHAAGKSAARQNPARRPGRPVARPVGL